MIIVNFFRYLFGYVCFAARGGFGDRFINLCNVHSIPLFNVSYKDGSIQACIPIRKIYMLKTVCKKSGVELKLLSEHGVYFYINKHCDRPGLFAGIFFYIVFSLTMQNFIWAIDIQQSKNVPEQYISELLYLNGLKLGTYKKDFDEIHCSRNIVNTLKNKIQWMSINIRGSKAFVEIHDYDIFKKDAAYGKPCNIIADFDGVLLSIDTYNGETVTKAGNGVNEGDLLISGIVENRDLSVSYCEARGEITALHNVNINRDYSICRKLKNVAQVKHKNYLYFLGIKIPISVITLKPVSYTHSNASYLSLNNSALPFGFHKYTDLRLNDKLHRQDSKKSLLLALEEYSDTVYKTMSDTCIVNSKLSLKIEGDVCNISTDFLCIDFIGKKQMINVNIF